MKRRDFFKWLGAGALALGISSFETVLPKAVPAPTFDLKAIEPLVPKISEIGGWVSYKFVYKVLPAPQRNDYFRRIERGSLV